MTRMAKKISKWLTENTACKPAVDLAEQCLDDREYYEKYTEPSFILWAIGTRQPKLALRIASEIASKLEVDKLIKPLLDVALVTSDAETLKKTLALAKLVVRDLSRREIRYADRIVVALLEWKLGLVDAPLSAGNVAEYVHRHNRLCGDPDAKAELMTRLRKKIPYDVWSKGL